MADKLGARKNQKWMAICKKPSIDWTPIGPLRVQVPYTVTSDLSQSKGTVSATRFNGDPIYLLDQSTQPHCVGDESGTGGGIYSGTYCGEVKPAKGSSTVQIHGKSILRHGDPCTMNNENTIGQYVAVPPPLPGEAPPPLGVFVTLKLSQENLCAEHSTPIEAIGTPEGGIYEWSHSKNCQLLDASGLPSLTGKQLSVKLLKDSNKSNPDLCARVTVTYKHPNGEVLETRRYATHGDLPLKIKWQIWTGAISQFMAGDNLNRPTEVVSFKDQRYALIVIPGMNMDPASTAKDSKFSHIGNPDESGHINELLEMQQACNFTFQTNQSVLIYNATHKLMPGDIAQSAFYELIGSVDPLVISTADAVLTGLHQKGEVYVVAHSQGSAIFDAAIPLIMERTTPEQRKKIHYQGFGSESFIHNYYPQFGSVRNVRNIGDPIPDLGASAKAIKTYPKLMFDSVNHGLQETRNDRLYSLYESWEIIDSQVPWGKLNGCPFDCFSVNRHAFIENYWGYVKTPSKGSGTPDTMHMHIKDKHQLISDVNKAKVQAKKWAKGSGGFKVAGTAQTSRNTNPLKKRPEVIIPCFIDGTGNNASARSNIRQMYESLLFSSNEKAKHFVAFPKYCEGPGAWSKDYPGQVLGTRSMTIAEKAYSSIVEQYIALKDDGYPDPKIDIYGFSRGAAIANEVAWMIDARGIRVNAQSLALVPPHRAKVRFLGLFETVHSMGMPGPNTSDKWHNRSFPPNVEHCAHAMGAHENRIYFALSILERIPGTGPRPAELIFPGVHSDIGGHRDNNPFIMLLTRSWMAEQATKSGVPYLKGFILSEAEKNMITNDPEKTKPGPEGLPDENFFLSGNPLYWEHERVQMANKIAASPYGDSLKAVLDRTPVLAIPARIVLKPGKDTFANQPRLLHEVRKFPKDMERLSYKKITPAVTPDRAQQVRDIMNSQA